MKVIISAGGTGGHIYPALAIVNKIKEKNPSSTFLYIGTHNRMEKDIVPNHNIPFKSIKVYGFYRKHIFKNFKTIYFLIISYFKCRKIIKKFNPDIVIGVGGYVTAPVILAASKLKYKTIIHEQNSIPGKSNIFLSKYVDKIVISFRSSAIYLPKTKVSFTGNPCSEYARNAETINKSSFGLTPESKLVYIVMGSLGSGKVNKFISDNFMAFKNKGYEVLFVTGKDFYDEISFKSRPENVKIEPYIDNQARLLKQADVVITRCGATTLSEIIALQIPSILIPSPYVPDNHQYKNGLDLVQNNAAIMIEEKDLNINEFINQIDNLIKDEKKLNTMKKSLKSLDIKNSASIIYDEIKELVDRK
ncbi:MAG: undecaprenyldiphospho-muramoylpentapeptide beta-N-acetylglucosaminyltransferase [Bacilli bacterium]|nr:undecaprenyldiphospho-muramoylpentapeptide beta-N-acetylglucosaminyltransferase [Bacilli bacterium]